ncbi:MAG: hypothetical protein A2V88_08755 [Elusimicrobia bacterium RBG_16_66_12]|nr:MAG: hypothetical protein A2V88_08755 [Elusimicrobia bacterium RBG_16_66_12]
MRIEVTDFLSYGRAALDLDGLGLVALAGENGAGKSALAVDALTWGLWGESRARSDDDLVRAGGDECAVTIDVRTDRGSYRVARRRRLVRNGRAGASSLTLERLEDGAPASRLTAESIRETQERLNAILGLDGQTFINTACLVQGRADEFARASPKDRKAVLAEILGLRAWQDWAERARARRRQAEAGAAAADASAAALRRTLEGKPGLEAELASLTPAVEGMAERRQAEHAAVEEARTLAAAQAAALAERDSLRREVSRLETVVSRAQRDLSAMRGELGAMPALPRTEQLLQTCPTCGQRIDSPEARHRAEAHVAKEAVRRADLKARLQERHGEMDEAAQESRQAREQLACADAEIEAVGDQGARLAQAEAVLAQTDIDLARYQNGAASLRGRLDQMSSLEAEAAELETRQARLAAEGTDWQAVEAALGPNGVQAMLIDAAVPEIVDEANRLLAILSGQTTIDLRTQRTGKTTGREIETLDLLVADTLGVRPYEMYSGGERFRVDFAARIALSRILARRAQAPCRTLVIDEGFGSQDGRGREALMEALSAVAPDFGLIMVISHVDDLQDALPSTIRVQKTPAGSVASLS